MIEEFESGATQGTASNMRISGDTLFSYGHHFPLVIRYAHPGGHKFLVNGDRYSITTACHQRQVFNLGPQVPFSALRAAGMDPREALIVDSREDRYRDVPDPTPDDPDRIRQEHTLGAALLEYRGESYLSSLDENEPWHMRSYFLCRLPGRAQSVADAFDGLVPDRVKQYRASGAGKDLRQGEWFFLPSDLKTRHLPRPSLRAAPLLGTNHYVTEIRTNGNPYGRGVVRHKPEHRRPQHRKLVLGPQWHEAVKNLAVASWNAEGNVD